MTKEEYQLIVKEALGVLSEPPPGKTKETTALTGLLGRDIRSVLKRLKREWQVSRAQALTTDSGNAREETANPARKSATKSVSLAFAKADPPPGKTKRRR